MKLTEVYVLINEMARQREEAMWAVLDWAASQNGKSFTIKDLHRIWAQSGGGGDSASYQQFSTAINNYIFKFDPRDPKYKNPRYKYIRMGKTDKGTVPAPLEFVSRGTRGAGNASVLRWRQGIPPMRTPSAPKKPLAPKDDPIGGILDKLEAKIGRPALKAAMQRWKQLGDLHKISADIMADVQIKGRDKMLALQVAASSLVGSSKPSNSEIDSAEEEMADEVGSGSNEFDDDEKTDPDAKPLGAMVGSDLDDEDIPDDLLHGDDEDSSGGNEEGEEPGEDEMTNAAFQDSDVPQSTFDEPADSDEIAPVDNAGEVNDDSDDTMRGFLIGSDDNEGQRIPVVIVYDEDDGATVQKQNGESVGPYEGFKLEVANGVLTQDAFDDLEEDGWELMAPIDSAEDESDEDDSDSDDDEDAEDDSDEPDDGNGSIRADDSTDKVSYLPEPNEDGNKYENAMYELDEYGIGPDDSIWEKIHASKNSVDAHRIIKASSIPHNLQRYALSVARFIFDNSGRDFDSGEKKKNESIRSKLYAMYGITESPLLEPVDFDQKTGLKRIFKWRNSR